MDAAVLDWTKQVIEDVVGALLVVVVPWSGIKVSQFVNAHIANMKDLAVKDLITRSEGAAQKLFASGAALAYADFSKKMDSVHDIATQNTTFDKLANNVLTTSQAVLTMAGYSDPTKIATAIKAETFKLLANDPNFVISTSASKVPDGPASNSVVFSNTVTSDVITATNAVLSTSNTVTSTVKI